MTTAIVHDFLPLISFNHINFRSYTDQKLKRDFLSLEQIRDNTSLNLGPRMQAKNDMAHFRLEAERRGIRL